MTNRWIETLTGSLEQKQQYRQHKARIDALPEPYATAAAATHRYVLQNSGITDGAPLVTMFGDLADLWERAAADGTPLRRIVGDDPVDFAETFAQAYSGARSTDPQRARLVASIDDAERQNLPGQHT